MLYIKTIFILLTKTNSILSRTIEKVTGDCYTHVAISLNRELTQMYSFGRKKKSNPFIGGFVHESIQNGIYALNQEAKCMLFSLDVTEKAYENINNMICDIHSNKEQYKYNFIGLFNVLLGWNVRRKKRYFCSEFVTEVLQYANTIKWDKPPALTKPSDFQNMPELSIVFEGKLRLVA